MPESVVFDGGARLAPGRDRRAVAFGPRLEVHSLGQKRRGDSGKHFDQCPHGLAGQLHTVQIPHRGDHVRGIGPLLATGIDQPQLTATLEQPVESEPGQITADQSSPEFRQNTVIRSRATAEVCLGTSGHGIGRIDIAHAPTPPRPSQHQPTACRKPTTSLKSPHRINSSIPHTARRGARAVNREPGSRT